MQTKNSPEKTHAHMHTLDLERDKRVAILPDGPGPLGAKVQLCHMLHSNKETSWITETARNTMEDGWGVELGV